MQKPYIIYGMVIAVCSTGAGNNHALVLDVPAPQPTIIHYDIENIGREIEFDNLPSAPGVYVCTVEVDLIPGYICSDREPSMDDWTYSIMVSTRRMEFKFPWPAEREEVTA